MEKAVFTAVTHSNSLAGIRGTFGTIVSAAFLFLIGLLNLAGKKAGKKEEGNLWEQEYHSTAFDVAKLRMFVQSSRRSQRTSSRHCPAVKMWERATP